MSLLFQRLNETYEANKHLVGKIQYRANDSEYTLLPVSHSTQIAHVEVTISGNGDFLKAAIIEGEKNTIIPITEASANRTANICPHPLHDKLMYVAGDFVTYTGLEKKKDGSILYLQQLAEWVDSAYSTIEVQALYHYLSKKTLIEDLVKFQVCHVNDKGLLMEKWKGDKKDTPSIFKAVPNVADTFIRFSFENEGEIKEVWNDQEFIQTYSNYSLTKIPEEDICYVTGRMAPTSKLQSSKIRHTGDKAKLISFNSDHPEGALGRFTDSRDNYSISYEASQKAHNTLKWLIAKQGFNFDGRVFLIWSKNADNTKDLFQFLWKHQPYGELKRQLEQLDNDEYYLLVLDALSIGRLSVISFNQFRASELKQNLLLWQQTCYWELLDFYIDKKVTPTVATPSLKSIIETLHIKSTVDSSGNSALYKMYFSNYLELILAGKSLPKQAIKNAIKEISAREKHTPFEWQKNLQIFCAILNHSMQGGEFTMGLNTENTDRSYLYGRLLAISEVLEYSTYTKEEFRQTNAERLTNQFSIRPANTWKVIQERILPYYRKLGTRSTFFKKLISDVSVLFENEQDFMSNQPLSEMYLLGYYHQRAELFKKQTTEQENKNDE